MNKRDVSNLAFLSEAYARALKNKTNSVEIEKIKKMLNEFQIEVFGKKHRFHRVLREIEKTVDSAADKMKKKKQSEYPSDLAKYLLRNNNPDKKMAGQTLNWNLQNMESQKRRSGRTSKPIPRY